MPRYEITKSLIESWYYVHDCWEGQEEAAMESFLHTLRREPEELPEDQKKNIQNGIIFEDMIYAEASGKKPLVSCLGWERGVSEIVSIVRGAQFQVRIHKPITVNGMDFEIHGVLDALREGTIFDFKFRNKSFGSLDLAGSYYGSAQHPFYFFLVPEARRFMYLVSDGSDIYIEQYTPDESRTAEEIISEFMQFLDASGLMDEYKEHWKV